MIEGKVFLTGGTGTLGKAIIRRAHEEDWPCEITVFSRDPMKQFPIKKEYPDVKFVVGDVCDFATLANAIAGHDIVLHLAAQKHIPTGEFNVMQTISVNLNGSINVAEACYHNLVKKVVGISTDKVVHAVNTYGSTKYLMEKVFQEYAMMQNVTKFNLVRYGNVLGSTGSVIQVWREMEKQGTVYATDPDMSRFWLTVNDAVNIILHALHDEVLSGDIVIPKCGACTMEDLAIYTLKTTPEYLGIRPGEKRYEELLGAEESRYATVQGEWFYLSPTTSEPTRSVEIVFDSNVAGKLFSKDIKRMIGE